MRSRRAAVWLGRVGLAWWGVVLITRLPTGLGVDEEDQVQAGWGGPCGTCPYKRALEAALLDQASKEACFKSSNSNSRSVNL